MPDILPWDAVRYCNRLSIKDNGRNEVKEAAILKAYPPPSGTSEKIMDTPSIIVDMHGVILAWGLPGVLPMHRQASTYKLVSSNIANVTSIYYR